MGGMAGATVNIALQLGVAAGLAIQAGLLTVYPGNVQNYTNIQTSLWFQFGWILILALIGAVFLRKVDLSKGEEADGGGKPR